MSYQRDYILRMIEMIGDLIAGILGFIKKKDFQKAEDAIDQVYQDYLREDAAFFRKIGVDDLTHELIQEHHYTHGHLEVLAELFYVEAELQKAKGLSKESMEYYRKSLKLHQFIVEQSETYSEEKEKKIEHITAQINQLKDRLN